MPKIGDDFFNQPSFVNTDPDAQRARPVVSCNALCWTDRQIIISGSSCTCIHVRLYDGRKRIVAGLCLGNLNRLFMELPEEDIQALREL